MSSKDSVHSSVPANASFSILLVHPNCELYGSDRTFLQSVRAVRQHWPHAHLTAVVTGKGPLYAALQGIANEVRVEDMFVLRRSHFGPRLLFQIPHLLARIRDACNSMNEHDIVYINTVIVIDYLLASRFSRIPCLVHVHELPLGLTRRVFGALLRVASTSQIFISRAVRNAFPSLSKRRNFVIWNGTRDLGHIRQTEDDGYIHLLLIGRFNAWKGQALLLDALALLPPELRARVRVRLVGSAFAGQEYFVADVRAKVGMLGLDDVVDIFGFAPVPDEHYCWANVVVVPSTNPEPFGLVAIEAMSSGRPVIASSHGGLAEIVVDGQTGTLFAPGNEAALASAIARYILDPSRTAVEGRQARQRFEREFREEIYMSRIAQAIWETVQAKSTK